MTVNLNFTVLVLDGYYQHRKFMGQYFFRQLNSAKQQNYGVEEFFYMCLDVCDQLLKDITDQVRDRKLEITLSLSALQNGTYEVELEEGESREQVIARHTLYWQNELELKSGLDWVGSARYNSNLNSVTRGQYHGILYYTDIMEIVKGIRDAIRIYRSEVGISEGISNKLPKNDVVDFDIDNDKLFEIETHAAGQLYEILKNYFAKSQQAGLRQLLLEGIVPDQPLIFNGNGNKLSDSFLRLYNDRLLTCPNKKALISWIVTNFNFKKPNGVICTFKSNTVEVTVSRNNIPCKNPIIKIENGQVLRAVNK